MMAAPWRAYPASRSTCALLLPRRALPSARRRSTRTHAGAGRPAQGFGGGRGERAALERLRVDHLVYGVPGPLEAAIEDFHRLTGVRPAVGGRHENLGTHNALVSLGGGAYFEILARDPAQPAPPRTWLGIDGVLDIGAPRLTTWCRLPPGDLSAAVRAARALGYDPGEPEDFARLKPDGSSLEWSLAVSHFSPPLPGDGLVPFLISWRGPSPAASAPAGCSLVGLRAEHPEAAAVEPLLRAVGVDPADLRLAPGPAPRLVATLDTPRGPVHLG